MSFRRSYGFLSLFLLPGIPRDFLPQQNAATLGRAYGFIAGLKNGESHFHPQSPSTLMLATTALSALCLDTVTSSE